MGPMVMQQQAECDVCGGRGKVCGVDAMTSKQEVLNLDVYPGCPENAVFVFPGMTNESLNAPTGDLILKIVYTTSKTYKVIENTIDLELRDPMKITLYDSLVGFSRTITHPLGHKITIQSSTPLKPGRYCVEGCGIHLKHTAYDKHGDIYFTLDVEYPTKIDTTQMGLNTILKQSSIPTHVIPNNEFVANTTIDAMRVSISNPRPYHNIESFVKHQNEKATDHMRKSSDSGGCTQS
jgi:DnaJ-class molecular chaperone